jgi:hypothetical protein
MNHPVSRWSAILSLVLAPVCGLVAAVATPGLDTTTKGELASIAAHPERFHVYALGILLSSYLLVPAFFGLGRLLRDAGVRGGTLAIGLTQVGAVIAVGDAATELVVWKMGTAPERGAMVRLGDAYAAGSDWIYSVGGLAVTAGCIAVAVLLWRSQVIPRWAAVGVAGCCVLNILGFSLANQQLLVASYLVMLVALSRAALALLDPRDSVGAGAAPSVVHV